MRFLKRLLIISLVLAGVLWLYGRSLPREHVASSTITLLAPADTVWKLVRNFQGHPEWWNDVKRVSRLEGRGGEAWEEDMGPSGMIQFKVTREVPGRQLVVTILNETQQDWGGVWTYDVVTTGAGTSVTITEEGWIESPFFRVVSKLTGQYRTIDSLLRSLGAQFGEISTPRHG